MITVRPLSVCGSVSNDISVGLKWKKKISLFRTTIKNLSFWKVGLPRADRWVALPRVNCIPSG